MPTVKLPNGETAKFPDGMSEGDIQKEIEKSFPSEKSWGQAVKSGISNLPGSVYRDFLKPAAEAIVNPSPFITDPVQKYYNPEEAKPPLTLGEGIEGLVKDYGEAYGGAENIKNTIANHPGRIVGDISLLATPGAKAAQLGGLAKAEKVLQTTADVTNPLGLAGRGIQKGRELISGTNIPEEIYARTMKIPPGSLREEQRRKVLNTLVRDEKLPLGKSTVPKMNEKIATLDKDIHSVLDNLSQGGSELNIDVVEKALDGLKSKYVNRTDPSQYIKVIDDVKADYANHWFVNNGKISLVDAIDLNKGTYQEIQDFYAKKQKPETGRVGIHNDVEAAAKAKAAAALRDAIINHPDVPPNIKADLKTEAGLMNSRRWVERAINRGGNVDVVSLSGMVFGTLVGQYHVPAAIAWSIAKSQALQSRLALGLAHGSETLRAMGSVTKPAVPLGYGLSRSENENWNRLMER